MKKIIAILLVCVLSLSALLCSAEELFETAPVFNFTEEDLNSFGVPGSFTSFEELGLRVWLPEGFSEIEPVLGANDTDVQMMRVFASNDYNFVVSVSIIYIEGVDTYEAMADKYSSEMNAADVAPVIVNGSECLLCDSASEDGIMEQDLFIIGGNGSWLMLSITSIDGEEENALAEIIELSLQPMVF